MMTRSRHTILLLKRRNVRVWRRGEKMSPLDILDLGSLKIDIWHPAYYTLECATAITLLNKSIHLGRNVNSHSWFWTERRGRIVFLVLYRLWLGARRLYACGDIQLKYRAQFCYIHINKPNVTLSKSPMLRLAASARNVHNLQRWPLGGGQETWALARRHSWLGAGKKDIVYSRCNMITLLTHS